MQAHLGDWAYFDQESTILDSNSEEAWGETKMCPREWELGYPLSLPLPTHFSKPIWRRIYDLRASKRKHLQCRLNIPVTHCMKCRKWRQNEFNFQCCFVCTNRVLLHTTCTCILLQQRLKWTNICFVFTQLRFCPCNIQYAMPAQKGACSVITCTCPLVCDNLYQVFHVFDFQITKWDLLAIIWRSATRATTWVHTIRVKI